MTFFRSSNALPWLVIMSVMTSMVGQSKGVTCGSTFFSALVQLIPCRPAVAPFSSVQPTEFCCTALKNLGQACLCALVSGPPVAGVDRNMAMLLPEKCLANFDPCDVAK